MPAYFDHIAKVVVKSCDICRMYERPLNKPTLRAEMAGFFNDIVQCDLFWLWDKWWALLVDEATRFKIAGLLATKHGKEIIKFVLRDW